MLRCVLLFVSLTLTLALSRPSINDIHRSVPVHYRNKFSAILNSAPAPASVRPAPHPSFTGLNQPIDQSIEVVPPVFTRLSPLEYGADPYATRDSTAAFQAIVHDLLNVWPNQTRYLSDSIIDLGGATIDLEGGDYLISKPIRIPAGYGNFKISGGSIRANVNFPKGKHLIHIGNETDAAVFDNCGQCSWGAYIDLTELLLDASHIADGGVAIVGVMGSVLSKLYVMHYVGSGVMILGGHEVQLMNSWFGANLWRAEVSTMATSAGSGAPPAGTIGVSIVGYDDVISNVIVFSAGLGAYIRGACNLVYGLHTWNGNTNGVWFDGDMSGSASAGSNRIDSSYLDFSNLILSNPWQMLVTNNFFLGGGQIVLKTALNSTNPMRIGGLTVTNNQFNSVAGTNSVPSVVIDESAGAFVELTDVTFSGNVYTTKNIALSTRVRASQDVVNGTEACFDLSQSLLFPQFPITFFMTSFRINGTGTDNKSQSVRVDEPHQRRHIKRLSVVPPPAPPQPASSTQWTASVLTTKLPSSLASGDQRGACIAFHSPVTGTVFIDVDQSTRSQGGAN